jgi:hypothetical protein
MWIRIKFVADGMDIILECDSQDVLQELEKGLRAHGYILTPELKKRISKHLASVSVALQENSFESQIFEIGKRGTWGKKMIEVPLCFYRVCRLSSLRRMFLLGKKRGEIGELSGYEILQMLEMEAEFHAFLNCWREKYNSPDLDKTFTKPRLIVIKPAKRPRAQRLTRFFCKKGYGLPATCFERGGASFLDL